MIRRLPTCRASAPAPSTAVTRPFPLAVEHHPLALHPHGDDAVDGRLLDVQAAADLHRPRVVRRLEQPSTTSGWNVFTSSALASRST
jgi:hypothetical protein